MADTELKQHVYAQRQDRAQAPVLTRNISISVFKFKVHKRKAGDVWTSRSGTEGGQEVFSQPSVTCQGFPVAHNIGLYTSVEHSWTWYYSRKQHLLFRIHDGWGRSWWHDGMKSCYSCSVSVCVSVLWRANGKTTRSDWPRRLTDELTGSDALFIKKDQLGLRRDGGQHLDLRQGHTLHCWVRLRSTFKWHFAAISCLFSFLLLVNDWTASPRASRFHTNHEEVVL